MSKRYKARNRKFYAKDQHQIKAWTIDDRKTGCFVMIHGVKSTDGIVPIAFEQKRHALAFAAALNLGDEALKKEAESR